MYATVASFPVLGYGTADHAMQVHAGVEEFCSMEEWLVDCKNHGRQTLRTKATGVMNGCYTWRTYV